MDVCEKLFRQPLSVQLIIKITIGVLLSISIKGVAIAETIITCSGIEGYAYFLGLT